MKNSNRNIVVKVALAIIKWYQIISSLKPFNRCRFVPTCSQYASQALKKYGLLKGLSLGLKRIGRCHPWNKGGFDPLK